VCASKFWFNYRHTSNAVAVYNSVRARGVPDARILLLLADDAGCNGRNPAPACMRTRDGGPDDACVPVMNPLLQKRMQGVATIIATKPCHITHSLR
jgi:hypothetical protein